MSLTLTKSCLFMATLLAAASISTSAQAGSVAYDKAVQTTTMFEPFAKGSMELEITGGAFGAIDVEGDLLEPDVGFALGDIRLGWMLNDPSGSGAFRGNFELLFGAFGGWVFDGPGDYLVGAELGLRYNFVQPSAKIVPFIQIGGGGVYSDMADDDPIQDLVGSDWSWQIHGAVGLRFMLSEYAAVTVMAQYFHVSNAGSDERNHGLDTLGGLIGVSFFF